MALFFSPSKTGLLGPKPDMFSQLGKGEEWMPEDSLGGFCLGKHPACGRHWATQHVHWACGLRNQYLFPSRPPKCFVATFVPVCVWHSFLVAVLPLWTILSVSFLLSLFGTDGQLCATHCAVCPVVP